MEEAGFEFVFLIIVVIVFYLRFEFSMCLFNLKLGVFSRWVFS